MLDWMICLIGHQRGQPDDGQPDDGLPDDGLCSYRQQRPGFEDVAPLVILISIASQFLARDKDATSAQTIGSLQLRHAVRWFNGCANTLKFLLAMQCLLFAGKSLNSSIMRSQLFNMRDLCRAAALDTRVINDVRDNMYYYRLKLVHALGQREPSHEVFDIMHGFIVDCPRSMVGEIAYAKFLKTVRGRVRLWEASACKEHSGFGDSYRSLYEAINNRALAHDGV